MEIKVAYKFVNWDVLALEMLQSTRVHQLWVKFESIVEII